MGNNARRKERHRLKRKQLQAARRRTQSGSPYRKIGASGEPVACYINRQWRTQGIASMLVLRQAPGGGHAMGAFLVDMWCLGLKDAWGRLDISRDEFEERIFSRTHTEVELVRVEPTLVRRLVAGGIRFANQNGFRLPRHYERWVSLLGGVGDWKTADLSDFGIKGGRLRYVGPPEDLERRLIGSSIDQFLARKDVEFIVGPPLSEIEDIEGIEELGEFEEGEESFEDEDLDGAFDTEEEDDADAGEIVEGLADRLQQRALDTVRQWCFSSGRLPHPRLADALDITFTSMMQVEADPEMEEFDGKPMEEAEALGEKLAEAAGENMERLLSFEAPADDAALREAMLQLGGFTAQFKTPEEFLAALGVDGLAHPE